MFNSSCKRLDLLKRSRFWFRRGPQWSLGVLALQMVLVPSLYADSVYRYEDGSGTTVYQDRMPSARKNNGHSVLSNRGVVVNQVLSREQRREARKRELEQERLRTRDKALLTTFTTEDDLMRKRDEHLGMIDSSISRLDDRVRILSERLSVLERRIEGAEASGKQARADQSLYAERKRIQSNIENTWSLIDSKAVERSTVADKFAEDLQRYRELKRNRS